MLLCVIKKKAQNELMRDQYQKQIEMLRSYELVNKYKVYRVRALPFLSPFLYAYVV